MQTIRPLDICLWPTGGLINDDNFSVGDDVMFVAFLQVMRLYGGFSHFDDVLGEIFENTLRFLRTAYANKFWPLVADFDAALCLVKLKMLIFLQTEC